MLQKTLFAVFAAFIISFLLFPVVIRIFTRLNWFDAPGTRKIHSEFVPSMGGVSILAGAVLALLITLPLQQWIAFKYFFISIVLIFLIGLRDDVLALTPRQKLVSQFLPVFILVFLDNLLLVSFYEMDGGQVFPLPLSYFISFLTVVIIGNAYNLIDGIDGLAGTVGIFILVFFGVWFQLAEQPYVGLIALCFAGALGAFLVFNWEPSKIFMGDTGALTIGLIVAYLAIRFINYNAELPAMHPAKFGASVSTALCIVIIPVFDTLRVIILRLRKFQSPFHADRNHIHHQFLSFGMAHATAVRWIAGINLAFIGLAVAMKNQPDVVLLPLIVVICLLINFVLKWRQKKLPNSLTHARTT